MKNKSVKEIFKTAILLFLICGVCGGILAGVNSITAPLIAAGASAAAEKSKSRVLPLASSFEELTLSDGSVCWLGKTSEGEAVGYVFNTSASGYGGKIQLMTGIDKSGAVTGISILSISETPGLGMNAKKAEWQAQFTGTTAELSVIKNAEAGENEINGISSATITSKAVTACVNAARLGFEELNGREANQNG